MKTVLVVHAGCVFAMTGILWLVQLLVYPTMAIVAGPNYSEYQAFHVTRITPVVGPTMLLELATAVALVLPGTVGVERASWWSPAFAWGCLAATGAVFVATALWSVPRHNILAHGIDAAAHQALVSSNLVRTLVWSAHSVLCGVWLHRAIAD